MTLFQRYGVSIFQQNIQFWISSCRFNTCCGVMHRCEEFNNAYSVIEIYSGFIAIWFECGPLIEYHVKNFKERNELYMYLCFCKIWVAQEVLSQIWISLGICLNLLFSKCQIKQEKMMQSTDARLSDYRYSDSGNAKRNFIIFLLYRQILGYKIRNNLMNNIQKCGCFLGICRAWPKYRKWQDKQ